MTLAPGTTIGRYQILGPLGVGGMAAVYKAFQPSLEREVALKLVRRGVAEDTELIERFKREAKAIARLRHPNIVQVFDFEVAEGGELVLAMELLDGGTLKQRLIQLAALGKRLDRTEAVRIIWEVADALTYAHAAGVIHRDVKPSNVMLTQPRDRAVVTDFGIARVLTETAHTATGVGVGTPEYMAPEQAQGSNVDHRADIYSLGAVAYETLVGRVPYKADTPLAVALAHVRDPLPLPSSIDPSIGPGIEKALLKALAKDPASRFDSAISFAEALKAGLAEDRSPRAIGGHRSAPDRPPRLRRRVLTALGGVAALVLGFGAITAADLLPGPGPSATPTVRPSAPGAVPTAAPTVARPSVTPAPPPTPSPRPPRFAAPARGALIWEAALDGTANDVSAQGPPEGNPPTIRTTSGAIEIEITRPDTNGGFVPRGLAIPDRDRYVAEVDLSFEDPDLTFIWSLRRPTVGITLGLVLMPTTGLTAYQFKPQTQPEVQQQAQALAREVPIPGLVTGRTVTIAVVAAHPRYEVWIDGVRSFEFTTTETGGTATPMFGVEGHAGVVRIGRLQYYSAP